MQALALTILFALIQAPTGVVAGRIRAGDGKPAVGMRVAAMLAPEGGRAGDADAGALFSQTQTDENGRYRLENIPPGRYYIMAGRVDAPTFHPGTTDLVGATAISVASGSPIEGIDFTVAEVSARPAANDLFGFMGSISGRQIVVAGAASPNIPIGIRFTAEAGSRIPVMSPRGRVQVTATPVPSSRSYTVGLPAGVYAATGTFTVVLRSFIPGVATSTVQADGSMTVTVSAGDCRFAVDNLPDDYEVKAMSAGPVDILQQPLRVAGPVSSGLLVTVGLKNPRPIRAGRIVSGKVIDGITGKPWTAESVFLSGSPGTLFSDGSFEFSRVTAGRYTLQAREGPPGGRTAESDIVVGTSDLTANVTYATIPANVRVTGQVVAEGGSPSLTSIRIEPNTGTSIATAADGTFTMTLPEGGYRLSVSGLPAGFALKSISSGSEDVLAEPLRIQPRNGPMAPGLLVTLAPIPRVKVRGRVIADPPTRTVEGADVALTGGPQGYTTRAAADGTFEFPPVLPGQYTLMIRHFGFTNVTETVVVAGQDLNLAFKSTPLY